MTISPYRLTTADGQVDHAWMDAAVLSEEYAGIRCRIAVGEAGGLVCDDVESHHRLNEALIRVVATDAVVTAVRMSHLEDDVHSLLIDDEGRKVMVRTDDDESPDVDHVVTRQSLETLHDVAKPIDLPWTIPIMLVVSLVLSLWWIYQTRDDLVIAAMFAVASAISIWGIVNAVRARYYLRRHSEAVMGLKSTATRETEQREVLNALVSRRLER